MEEAQYWINKLDLKPHPEGGYFKEIYRGKTMIELTGYDGLRNTATSIYFLLDKQDKSHFHRLRSDEIWYYHEGVPLTVCMFDAKGNYGETMLGKNVEKGEKLQVIMEAGTIFGAWHPNENGYTLMGCMVSPGFDFKDFELVEKSKLLKFFPDKKEIITIL